MRITDLVSPMDMTEFLAQDYDDIRMPVNALRFFVFNDKMKLELLAVPTFEGYKLPTDAINPWCILPKDSPLPIAWEENGSHPSLHFVNIEYGGKLSFTWSGLFVLRIAYVEQDARVYVSPYSYQHCRFSAILPNGVFRRRRIQTSRATGITRRSSLQCGEAFQL